MSRKVPQPPPNRPPASGLQTEKPPPPPAPPKKSGGILCPSCDPVLWVIGVFSREDLWADEEFPLDN